MIEHNLLSASNNYTNIGFKEICTLSKETIVYSIFPGHTLQSIVSLVGNSPITSNLLVVGPSLLD
jgi:hypothetical protein